MNVFVRFCTILNLSSHGPQVGGRSFRDLPRISPVCDNHAVANDELIGISVEAQAGRNGVQYLSAEKYLSPL
jgi:hypothetical protein